MSRIGQSERQTVSKMILAIIRLRKRIGAMQLCLWIEREIGAGNHAIDISCVRNNCWFGAKTSHNARITVRKVSGKIEPLKRSQRDTNPIDMSGSIFPETLRT